MDKMKLGGRLKFLTIYKSKNYGFYSFGVLLSKGLVNSRDEWVLSIECGHFHYSITGRSK